MSLEVIGAGFGRTGTESMKIALEMLGFGPCYHMHEVSPHPERFALWQDILQGKVTPDWDSVFDGFRSTVDWPAARFWPELADRYPEAKILLTVRPIEGWYASMEKTILPLMRDPDTPQRVGHLVGRDVFGDGVHDRKQVIAAYERNTRDVQARFGADRLLTYELGSGWEPLCAFLNVEVPDADFPRSNDPKSFQKRYEESVARRGG